MKRRSRIEIICGDCLEVVPMLPPAKLVWADPPDNLGLKYDGYNDEKTEDEYKRWLRRVMIAGVEGGRVFWLSHNVRWMTNVFTYAQFAFSEYNPRLFVWHYTFGQNRQTDFISSFRPILRLMKPNMAIYPDAVRIPSARQTVYNDKRADARGKMPDDVWEFPRVCGTFHERKRWHPCQHPKELLRRILRFSTQPKDLVIDMFAGSGNMLEVCSEEGRHCIGVDISKPYCDQMKAELRSNRGAPIPEGRCIPT